MKKAKGNRIFFPGNPWKKGHPVKEFVWTIRLVPGEGLYFDLHLRSEEYYAEEDIEEEEDADSSWESPSVWGNYHQVILSSTYWGSKGILVGSESEPLNLKKLEGRTFRANQLTEPEPEGFEECAFNIYLLGHDSCADHRIEVVRQTAENEFDLRWRGKIALTYVGDEEFCYDFDAHLVGVSISDLNAPEELSQAEFEAEMDRFARNWMDFPGIE